MKYGFEINKNNIDNKKWTWHETNNGDVNNA